MLSGVTVVTHGFQPFSGEPEWTITLGQAILERADGDNDLTSRFVGSIYKNDPSDGKWKPLPHFDPSYEDVWSNSNNPDHHSVFLFDWSEESNDSENGWLEAAADALFAGIVASDNEVLGGTSLLNAAFQGEGTSNVLDLHFIGHSRGAVLNSLVVERIGNHFSQYTIDHVTSLDPHPASLMEDFGFVEPEPSTNSRLFTFDNVQFADNYYQQDGEYEPISLDFNGVQASGAYNFRIPTEALDIGGSSFLEHSDVHTWYYGTVTSDMAGYQGFGNANQNHDGEEGFDPNSWYGTSYGSTTIPERDQIGFVYSTAGNPSGAANRPAIKLESKQVVNAVPSVINGTFQYGDSDNSALGLQDELPGWERHGGDTDADLDGGQLHLGEELFADYTFATHNPLYFPERTNGLTFDYAVTRADTSDFDDDLLVYIGSTLVRSIPLNSLHSMAPLTIPLDPLIYGERVDTIRFELNAGPNIQSDVYIDNVNLTVAPETTAQSLATAFDTGLEDVRGFGGISGLVNEALGADLPLLNESVADLTGASDKLLEPFDNDVGPVDDISTLSAAISSLPNFTVEYASLIPEAGTGDLLRASFTKTWGTTTELGSFDLNTGFQYFDDNVDKDESSLAASLSAELQPVSLDITVGVDLIEGVPTFFISEDSSLDIGELSFTGGVFVNLGIRNLLDVDVEGDISGTIVGGVGFDDQDADSKLRTSQIADPSSIISPNLTGGITFTPTLKAELPIIGTLEWAGMFGAQYNAVTGEFDTTAQLNEPSVDIVQTLLENGYQTIINAFDLLGGINVDESLQGVGKNLADTLGLPSFLTDGTLGEAGISLNVTPQSISSLIKGETVDLIRFAKSGSDRYTKSFSVPLAAAAVPLGPVPLTLTVSWETEVFAGWNYYVGLGVDTSGFYIDPGTMIGASGGIQSGINASASLAGIAGVSISAGIGASLGVSAGLVDPDPRDGKIYLDELLTQDAANIEEALLNTFNVTVAGEAYAYARVVASLLFFDWELLNERTTLVDFSGTLAANNRVDVENENSQRNVTGRSPIITSDIESGLSLDSNGVLTVDTRVTEHKDNPNSVAINSLIGGGLEVVWRGAGKRTYGAGEVQGIVYHGNNFRDTLYVDDGIVGPASAPITVEAYGNSLPLEQRVTEEDKTLGNGEVNPDFSDNNYFRIFSGIATVEGWVGNDVIQLGDAGGTAIGGAGDDMLIGGNGVDNLEGGSGNDHLEGHGAGDTLNGGDDLDMLEGGDGDDMLDGGEGDDILHGGRGNDDLLGQGGRDFLYGEQDNDNLWGHAGDDLLLGGLGDDHLYGGNDNDTLFGDRGYAGTDVLDGDDFLYGQDGDDRLFGEGGNDLLEGDDLAESGADWLVGDAGIDILRGGKGDDLLLGGDDADELRGGDGEDILNGNGGADMLFGEGDDDTLQIDFASADGTIDEIRGNAGRDMLMVAGMSEQVIVDDFPVLNTDFDDEIRISRVSTNEFMATSKDLNTQIETSIQFRFDTTLAGDIELIGMQGLGGDDNLSVDDGVLDDIGWEYVLEGGPGNDTIIGGSGNDILRGGPGDDLLLGRDGDDSLYGDEGSDEINGEGGTDYASTGPGGDVVIGGGLELEYIVGGDGNDILVAENGFYGAEIEGGDGDDIIIGSSGYDFLRGGIGNDIIVGGGLNDVIEGGPNVAGIADDDILVGGLGQDTIEGGSGNDKLHAHTNNELLAQLILNIPQIKRSFDPALSQAEVDARIIQLDRRINELRDRRIELLGMEELASEQLDELLGIPDLISILRAWIEDLEGNTGLRVDRLFGDDGNDELYGSPYNDNLRGGEGNDAFFAGSAFGAQWQDQDSLLGDFAAPGNWVDTQWFDTTHGDDQVFVRGFQPDTNQPFHAALALGTFENVVGYVSSNQIERIGVRAGDGDDNVTINFGAMDLGDVIVDAGKGDDTVDASALEGAPATLLGGAGNDKLIGGAEDDILRGDTGDDQLFGGAEDDRLDGGTGNDYLNGEEDNDTLFGGLGNDILLGGGTDAGEDRLFGGDGEDELTGGDGEDYLYGGLSKDVLWGGGDSDTLVADSSGDFSLIPDTSDVWVDFVIPFNSENRVNTTTSGEQFGASVGHASDGGYIVVWRDNAFGAARIVGQRYDSHGYTKGDEFQVDVDTSISGEPYPNDVPDIAVFADGSFVVVWQHGNFFIREIHGQRFDSSGLPVGSQFIVEENNSGADGDIRSSPAIASADDGQFVVVWDKLIGNNDPLNRYDIYAQKYTAEGAKLGTSVLVNSARAGTQIDPDVAMDANGNFVVVWKTDNGGPLGIFAQRFNSSAQKIGGAFGVHSSNGSAFLSTAIAMQDNGDFVTTWAVRGVDNGSSDGVYAQRYSAQGAAIGSEFRVNSHTTDHQRGPAIGMNSSGDFSIAWESFGQEADGSRGVFAQRYSASGNPIGEEFHANTYIPGIQFYPAISVNAEGLPVITWSSEGQDGSDYGIYLQGFDATPPLVIGVGDLGNELSRTVSLSESLRTSGIGSAIDLANWQLLRDGADISNEIAIATYEASGKAGPSFVLLSFSSPLSPGEYELIAKGTIEDLAGRQLDGNGDGISGDDYIEHFTISPQPVAVGLPSVTNVAGTEGPLSVATAIDPSDSSYVVAWAGPGIAPDDTDIYAQRFYDDGVPYDAPIRVNTVTAGNQTDASIALDENGDYIIAWNTEDPATGESIAWAKRFHSSGAPFFGEDEFAVHLQPSSISTRPSVAVDEDGDFVVAWQSDVASGGFDVYAQRYTSDGHSSGDQVIVNSEALAGTQWTPHVAMNRFGDFIVTWASIDTDSSEVMARWFFRTDNVIDVPAFLVSSSSNGIEDQPRIAMNHKGEFAIVWRRASNGETEIYARRYDSERRAIGSEFRVNDATTGQQGLPDVAIDDDGNLAIIWAEIDATLGDGYTARWFDKWGNLLNEEFKVADVPNVVQESPVVTVTGPVLPFDASGISGMAVQVVQRESRLVVTGTTSGSNVKVSRFLADGTLDTSFGTDGTGVTEIDVDGDGSIDTAQKLLVDSQNRIVVIARAAVDTIPGVDGVDTGMGLIRLTENGNPDSSFGSNGNGIVYLPNSDFTQSNDESGGLFWEVDLQQDGTEEKIIVGAYSFDPSTAQTDSIIARFTSSGELDTSTFGDSDGQGGRRGYSRFSYSDSTDGVVDLIVLSDGRIVIAGVANPASAENPTEDTFLARYSSDGVFEDEFGDGNDLLDIILGGRPNNGLRITLQNDNGQDKILVAGRPGPAGESPIIARFNTDLTFDVSLGDNVTIETPFRTVGNISTDAFGNILVPGTTLDASGNEVFTVARYTADGYLDYRFAPGGVLPFTALTDSDKAVANRVFASSDGKIFATGEYGADYAIAVYDLPNALYTAVSDSEFFPDDWGTYIEQTSNTSTANVIRSNVDAIDGHYQRVDTHIDGGATGVFLSMVNNNVSYDSNVVGDIESIDVKYRVRNFTNGQIASAPRLMQADSTYFLDIAQPAITPEDGWTLLTFNGLTADMFGKLDGSGPAQPDFSADAFPIKYGYSLSTQGINGSDNSTGFDDFTVVISSQEIADEDDVRNTAAVSTNADGEFVITWSEPSANSTQISSQRYTLHPPTVEGIQTEGGSIVVAFSQEMATDGAGDALNPANWALRLADGRYLVQDDSAIPGVDPLATVEQFDQITQTFNPISGLWEVTLSLNTPLPAGTYQLIARSSLKDVAGRKLDGDGSGVISENYTMEFTLLSGDYDGNGVVDQEDYLVWKQSFGATSGESLRADGNIDGIVNIADYTVWRDNLGATAPAVDVNADSLVDGVDLDGWQLGFGLIAAANEALPGDADEDGDVDGADFLQWQRSVTTPLQVAFGSASDPAEPLASMAAVAAVDEAFEVEEIVELEFTNVTRGSWWFAASISGNHQSRRQPSNAYWARAYGDAEYTPKTRLDDLLVQSREYRASNHSLSHSRRERLVQEIKRAFDDSGDTDWGEGIDTLFDDAGIVEEALYGMRAVGLARPEREQRPRE